jgi:phage baseplate assembly protein W
MQNIKTYSDIDLSFKIHPLNNDINVLYGETAVKRELKHLILSNAGDFKFHPELDVGIRDLLFEPLRKSTAIFMKKRLEFQIGLYMPKVKVESINITTNENMDGFDISITFTTSTFVKPITTELFLQRIR